MPKPRERIQPLTPKLANSNTIPVRNNIESSTSCGSAAAFDMLKSLGWLVARAAVNVIPSVTGRKATEAATQETLPTYLPDAGALLSVAYRKK